MTAQVKKLKAQDLILNHLAIIGYGDKFDEFVKEIGDEEEATKVLKKQMDRIAKMFGYSESWFE
jgi:hypothetical protein